MKILKRIANICLIVLVVLSLLMSGMYLYYHYAIKPNHTTVGTNYIGEQTPIDLVEVADKLSEEKRMELENRVLFNVNYYSNDKGNGLEVQELRLDYFTDLSLLTNSIRSTGMQYIGDITEKEFSIQLGTKEEGDSYVSNSFYYYDTTDSVSWSGGNVATQLNRNTAMIVKIDNTPYLIQLDGTKVLHDMNVGKFLWIDIERDVTYLFTYSDLFKDVLTAVKTNSNGYGEFYIQLNLSKYFTNIREYNYDTKKFDKTPEVDIFNCYSYLKFNYYADGLVSSEQSMFGSVALNTMYGKNDISIEYTDGLMVYTLSEKMFNYRYSDLFDGYFISLDIDDISIFNDLPTHKINVHINIDSSWLLEKGYNVVGIDYNGFENLLVDTLTINGSGKFHILDNAMANTNLKTFEHSEKIFLTISDTAFNNEYVEVVL